MISLQLTEAEVKVMQDLVSKQLGRYDLLKECYNIISTENVSELKSLTTKLKDIQTRE